MISDILFDAIEDIRRYEADYPQVYTKYRNAIENVVLAMDFLRRELDTVPGGQRAPAHPQPDGALRTLVMGDHGAPLAVACPKCGGFSLDPKRGLCAKCVMAEMVGSLLDPRD